jgi:predicted nuclease of predicted toxin-antitoxin system
VRIKLDENLPYRLVEVLNGLGHDTDTVKDEGIIGSDDPTVWDAAQTSGRFFITQDLDFSDIRRFMPGTHHGLLLLRLHDPGREALFRRIRLLYETEEVESWRRCFVVMTEHKIRVMKPD